MELAFESEKRTQQKINAYFDERVLEKFERTVDQINNYQVDEAPLESQPDGPRELGLFQGPRNRQRVND